MSKCAWVQCGGKPGEVAFCGRCGKGLSLSLPIRIEIYVAASKAFLKIHSKCKEGDHFEKPATTPLEWATGRDTGTSSLTIYHVMTGNPSHHSCYDTPADPSDFGRCYRLLKLFPSWIPRLPEVSERFPKWKPLIDNWALLTKMYEEALVTKNGEPLYRFIKGSVR